MDALKYAVKYLAYRARTEREVVLKLRERGFGEIEIAKAMKHLAEKKYVDDLQYAYDYIVYALERKKGRFKIEVELKNKGVSQFHIEDAIYRFEEERGMELRDVEIENAYKIREQILNGCEMDRKIRDKIGRKMSYLGYSTDIILRIINE